MDALILSCSTGGGHNAAGEAIKEELAGRGHHVEMFDPYALISSRLASGIGNVYIKLVQKSPALFGAVYLLGELYRRLPFRSPVYFINKKPAKVLNEYLKQHHVDVIIMPHLFPAEMITHLKNKGVSLPTTVFIATDYACIPFTEETKCDYYVIPHQELISDFTQKGIEAEKIKPLGIPVRKMFSEKVEKRAAKEKLGLEQDKNYILVAGGSIGAGELQKVVRIFCKRILKTEEQNKLIIICGNNQKVYKKLNRKYSGQAVILQKTENMALYMQSSDLFISKPGGLSSTEAAVAGIPMLHSGPIPGCETKNRRFFEKHDISIPLKKATYRSIWDSLKKIQEALEEQEQTAEGYTQQIIPQDARERICDWVEGIISKKEK